MASFLISWIFEVSFEFMSLSYIYLLEIFSFFLSFHETMSIKVKKKLILIYVGCLRLMVNGFFFEVRMENNKFDSWASESSFF